LQTKRLIGIKGGTFDPIHFGHLRPALEVLDTLGLDEVRFIPNYQPVHRNLPQVSAQQRCEMVSIAIEAQPKFKLDKIEIDLGGPSFMVDTLEALSKKEADADWVLIMGTDAFAKFDQWKDWQRILQLANIAITHRPGEPMPDSALVGQIFHQHWVPKLTESFGQIVDVPVTQLDLSATALRSYLKQRSSVDYLLPKAVIEYIHSNGLYQ
jgi:nicotinate-nucleotide adenylyltransferase